MVVLDELNCGGPALVHLLLLVQEAGRGEHDPAEVALGVREGIANAEGRLSVVLGDEGTVQVAGAKAQFEDDRGVARLGELEALLDHVDDRREVRSWIEEPHLGFHREGVGPLLHDARALAVVLADDDESAAEDATGGEVGEGIGRDIEADGRLEGDGSAERVVDRCRERCGCRCLRGAVLEVDAELVKDVLCIAENIHEVRDRGALVPADVRDSGLQQALRDREAALAPELLASSESELLDRCGE